MGQRQPPQQGLAFPTPGLARSPRPAEGRAAGRGAGDTQPRFHQQLWHRARREVAPLGLVQHPGRGRERVSTREPEVKGQGESGGGVGGRGATPKNTYFELATGPVRAGRRKSRKGRYRHRWGGREAPQEPPRTTQETPGWGGPGRGGAPSGEECEQQGPSGGKTLVFFSPTSGFTKGVST